MEGKLKQYAERLPEPICEFMTLEEKGKKQNAKRTTSRNGFRVVIVVVLIACLVTTGFAYGAVKYGLWSGLHSRGFGDVVLLSWKYDYIFPEVLGGSPFLGMSIYYGAPEGATHLEALLMPTYELCSVDYGIAKEEERENGCTYAWTENGIHVSFGTTEKETWKYHFSVGEDGLWHREQTDPDSKQIVQYYGYTLYVFSIDEHHYVRWIDTERSMVINVTCYEATEQEDVLEIAKELIDLNR